MKTSKLLINKAIVGLQNIWHRICKIITNELKGVLVRNNFYPSKLQMVREIEKCAAAGKVETLLSFCKSCVFTKNGHLGCRTCVIKQAIDQSVENATINSRKN
jgi:hypothetical protein